MLMDQRVISTSAVRCVGNTLILQGRVYSPPYVITAIGNQTDLRGRPRAQPVGLDLPAVGRRGRRRLRRDDRVASRPSPRMPARSTSSAPGPPGEGGPLDPRHRRRPAGHGRTAAAALRRAGSCGGPTSRPTAPRTRPCPPLTRDFAAAPTPTTPAQRAAQGGPVRDGVRDRADPPARRRLRPPAPRGHQPRRPRRTASATTTARRCPGAVGNFAVAGHRTTYGRPFHDIDKLRTGDVVVVETKTAYSVYAVKRHEIVAPSRRAGDRARARQAGRQADRALDDDDRVPPEVQRGAALRRVRPAGEDLPACRGPARRHPDRPEGSLTDAVCRDLAGAARSPRGAGPARGSCWCWPSWRSASCGSSRGSRPLMPFNDNTVDPTAGAAPASSRSTDDAGAP